MAGTQHTQTHPKFTWLFLATPELRPECSPVVLRCDADSEEAARAIFPEWHLTFAAKIRTESPFSFTWSTWSDSERATIWSMMGSEIQLPTEVRHA
ncbi:TPA: host cell division inhibitor Icd-like protein [Citrobacter farmeri]|uniref:Uncharacterized protein n=1 Tax=Citrobacter farmeri TaxID=67824 RepID=A0ACA8D5V7_9ENTR|nr:host cell division inhibitor Icd-like protein [Citrobacter farmeri]AST79597.1 hypothetical protein CI104_11200 [Citrobacter farmeri]HAT2752548.1 host cell division inhibitor Icd-like protein [Citrobacter farmeri]HBI2995792.1 host cell division inhibitor Icd-like protein [Citrobacter farmeri]HBI3000907.1 host cell division inhibitor Icd-like protein [Citrobacter farmeri]HBI3006901.1 host cell division inhibitor Icd-like protein [Citrobacter farmeri]